MNASANIEEAFAATLAAHGLTPAEIVGDGRIHRFAGPEDKRGKESAWYVFFADGIGGGAYGDWKTGLSETWRGEGAAKLAPAERKAWAARIAELRNAEEAERARVRAAAASAARAIWKKARDASADSPYCAAKGIKPFGLKEFHDRRTLIVPIRNASGELVNLQFIDADGAKRFKTGGEVAGCCFQFGNDPAAAGVLLIGEGFATCASAFEATRQPVACAFNAGNLLAVARAWRERLPDARIVLLADDDHATEGNPGVTKATEAAHAIGGTVAVPDFGERRPDGATDFNDLHALAGLDAVRRCIEAAAAPATDAKAAPSDNDDEAAIERLASLRPMQYDRVRREEAKRLGVQLATLDRLVAEARGDGGQADSPFAAVEPWPESVDGAALLSALVAVVRRFIVCDEATAQAAALWIAMTWCMDSVDVAPIAAITAPEKRCGKSQLLFLIGRLSCRPLAASNITPAALFRAIEAWSPTLLIDEADAFMRENEELRGLLNCGHTRDSAYVVRTVGDDHTPKQFFVWGAKAIAGIGHLADTLMDRSITLELRRKLPNERADKLRHAEPGLFDDLRAQLARWAEDNADAIRAARPALPDALHDRAADNWEPLLQIAELAGAVWPERARRAALKLSGGPEEARSSGAELLADIKAIFEARKVQRIAMADLLAELLADEEAPWATWRGGRVPMTPRTLGKMLAEYSIKSKTVRIGYDAPKGFELEQFRDAFARYLPSLPVTPVSSVTQSQPNTGAGLAVTEAQIRDSAKTPSVTLEPLPDKACDRVTDETRKSPEEENEAADDEPEEDV